MLLSPFIPSSPSPAEGHLKMTLISEGRRNGFHLSPMVSPSQSRTSAERTCLCSTRCLWQSRKLCTNIRQCSCPLAAGIVSKRYYPSLGTWGKWQHGRKCHRKPQQEYGHVMQRQGETARRAQQRPMVIWVCQEMFKVNSEKRDTVSV